jgi:hypothetical protein
VILDRLTLDPDAFETRTGWAIKPEGACKGDICVPLPAGARTGGNGDGDGLDATVVAQRLGMPLLRHGDADLWALGPATVSGKALDTAVAPDLELPDVDGNPFKLSSLHGKKVLLVAWASW